MKNETIEKINQYYTDKIRQYGASPAGVDWNGIESQEKRFEQLVKVLVDDNNCSLLDYGCGYGGLLEYLKQTRKSIQYNGFDISIDMLKEAKEKHGEKDINWFENLDENFSADYTVASGLFNVKLESDYQTWEKYIFSILDKISQISQKGFAFNMLTSYSDLAYMKEYLYYGSPEFYFKHCKINYSNHVSLLHDYGLYEFTIIVKK
jgi:SAM-dependent methyltransferase